MVAVVNLLDPLYTERVFQKILQKKTVGTNAADHHGADTGRCKGQQRSNK